MKIDPSANLRINSEHRGIIKWIIIFMLILIIIAGIIVVFLPKNRGGVLKNPPEGDYSGEIFEGIEYPYGRGDQAKTEPSSASSALPQAEDRGAVTGKPFSRSATFKDKKGLAEGSDINHILETIEEVNRINKLNKEGIQK